MKLGSSISRRRRSGWGGSGGGRSVEDLRQLAETVGFGLALGVVGLAIGYLLATRAIFPAPAIADDLVTVPDLRGLAAAEVAEELRRVGLEPGAVDSIRHPSAAPGRVLGQTPLPGQLASPSDTVEVTISLGPERRAVPDVVRLQATRAATVLQATGFAVAVDSVEAELPRGRVVRVEPAPGTEANLPLDVRIFVSRGPPLVEMPDLVEIQEEDALARLDTLGLVAEVETVFRFGASQGQVVEQDPPPGTRLERGSAVKLVVGRRGIFQRNNPDESPYED